MSNALPAPDPSMDEILASIKRIIESGDEKVIKRAPVVSAVDGRSESPAPSIPAGYAEALRPAADEPRDDAAPENVADARWHSYARSEFPESDEDFAPRFAEAGDGSPIADDEPSGGYAESGGDRFDEDAFESQLVELIGDGDERASDGFAGVEQGNDMDSRARFAAANSDEAGLGRSTQALDEPPIVAARALSDPSETHRIISQEAGARVAASFEDLARAIREDQMRSVEDAVQEMLRPMLQEWLDDNLPRLVERLVREEIERVATGGRR